jgi:hypothetical protein
LAAADAAVHDTARKKRRAHPVERALAELGLAPEHLLA